VPELDRIGVLKPGLDMREQFLIVTGGDMHQFPSRVCSEFTVIQNDLSSTDNVTRHLEHPLNVLLGLIDRHISVRTDSQLPFMTESQHSCRSSTSDDGNFIQ